MYNETFNVELITIEAYQATWGSRLHKSDPDDVTPDGLIISFTKSDLENAMETLQKCPALLSVSINSEIHGIDFVGDIEGSHITIYNRAKTVYARFSNGFTGTEYELEITSDVPTTGEPAPKRLSPFNPTP